MRRWSLAAVGLALAFGVFGRAAPLHEVVFDGEHVNLLGVDAYYHLRHARFAMENFPRLQRNDVGTHWPIGERSTFAGLFDLVPGGIARLFGDLEPIAAWTPVILWALSLLLLYALLSRALGPSFGAAGAAIAALYPGLSLSRTVLGNFDHHAAEIALWLALGVALVRRSATGAVLVITAFLFTWPGAPMHLGLLLGAAGLASVAGAALEVETDAARVAHLGGAVGAIFALLSVVAPDVVLAPDFGLPMLIAAAGGIAWVHGAPRMVRALSARSGRSRPAIALALGLAGAALLAVALPAVAPDLVDQLWRPKPSIVSDHLELDAGRLWRLAGPFALAPPLAVAALLLRVRHDRAALTELHLVFPALALVLIEWRTGDYGYYTGFARAGLAAYVLHTLHRRVAPARFARGALAFAILSVVLVWPARVVLWPIAGPEIAELRLMNDGWREAMAFLRSQPRPRPAPDARSEDLAASFADADGGVLTAWSFGNLIGAYGGQVPVWSHGSNRRLARLWMSSTEAEALSAGCPRCQEGQAPRYAVLDARTLGRSFVALAQEAGVEIATSTVGRVEVAGRIVPLPSLGALYSDRFAGRLFLRDGEGLSHYRLIYESAHESLITHELDPASGMRLLTRPLERAAAKETAAAMVAKRHVLDGGRVYYGSFVTPSVKVFERVRGARITGAAAPGTVVIAELPLGARASKRKITYRQRTRAHENGTFELVVPYASTNLNGDLEPLKKWRLLIEAPDGERFVGALHVEESHVLGGVELAAGHLR